MHNANRTVPSLRLRTGLVSLTLWLAVLAGHLGACSNGSTVAKSTKGSSSDNDASVPAPSTPKGTNSDGSEEEGASSPQPVSGAYLVDCGIAGANGYGCLITDPKTGAKTTAPVQDLSVTVTYTNGTTSKPTLTVAPASDPWSVYFVPPAGQVPAMTSVQVSGSTVVNDVATAFASIAQTLTYIPALVKVIASTFASDTPIAFVSSSKFVPGVLFASKAEADALCQVLATSKNSILPINQSRTWHALLALSIASTTGTGTASLTTTAVTTIMSNLPNLSSVTVANSLGTPVGNAASFADSQLLAAINLDETGNAIPSGDFIWTGSLSASASGAPDSNNNCNNWSSSTGEGSYGIASTTATWLSDGTTACSTAQHIYCSGY